MEKVMLSLDSVLVVFVLSVKEINIEDFLEEGIF